MDMVESAPEEAGTPSPLEQRIQALQVKLDDLLLKYTKSHPEVVAVRKSIADLRQQKAKEDAEAAEAAAQSAAEGGLPPVVAENPVFQQMKLQLSEAEANIASLGARVKAYQDKIENLKKQMDNRLKVETELAGLNRDYEAVKANYNQLLTRRETARMSENVEQNTDSVKFRIVDPPQVPTKPAAPNRILLSTIALFAGIVVGFGLAVFLALLRPSYATTQKLRDVTGLPVLGSVSMNWIPDIRKRKWRQFVIFVAAFAMLLIVFAGVLALEVKGYHLPNFISV